MVLLALVAEAEEVFECFDSVIAFECLLDED